MDFLRKLVTHSAEGGAVIDAFSHPMENAFLNCRSLTFNPDFCFTKKCRNQKSITNYVRAGNSPCMRRISKTCLELEILGRLLRYSQNSSKITDDAKVKSRDHPPTTDDVNDNPCDAHVHNFSRYRHAGQ